MPDIDRVRLNEARLDEAQSAVSELLSALEGYKAALPKIAALKEYYSDDWKMDAADDDAGLFPPDLKRGVLSEDSVFDLLASDAAIRETAAEIFSDLQ